MAHMVKRMAYAGETPWHSLGAVITDPTDLDRCREEGGLDWDVTLEEVALVERYGVNAPGDDDHAPGEVKLYKDRKGVARPRVRGDLVTCGRAVIRTDTNKAIALVGNGYQPLSNRDAFEWFRPWVESGEATIETCGELHGGTRVWVLAKIKGTRIDVGDGDEVQTYALLAHAHNGKAAINAGLTGTRVVCHNTLSYALRGSGGRSANIIKVPHTKGAKATLDRVREAADQVRAHNGSVAEAFRAMTRVRVKSAEVVELVVNHVYGVKAKTAEEKAKARKSPRLEEITRLYEKGMGQDLATANGTAWGLLAAITEYETHHARTDEDAADIETRVHGLAFHTGKRRLELATLIMQDIALKVGGDKPRGIALEDVLGQEATADILAIAAASAA